MTDWIVDLKEWREIRSRHLELGDSVGFVPTMGALHDGHRSLIEKSLEENDRTVVSIFVNPTQFNDPSDFEKYPRTLDADHKLLSLWGANFLIAPKPEEMYPNGYEVLVEETQDSRILCGQFRPGHFSGVLTVVNKLLNLVQPTRAYFGEKDFQQLYLIKKMAESFLLPLEICACPTVRETGGLAMSSRNQRLGKKGAESATRIYGLIKAFANGTATYNQTLSNLNEICEKIEYLEIRWSRVLVAAWIDEVRLIDNVPVQKGEVS
ncbi:MAG: pantoate--beta-alanine ligase [Bdellovibrionales bacterium CG10_big_fil_rev_8_21_14_0_10_45_34]|nr:MAG: pantoate--beta-alanine ligase [Bdellovibrionales bacterium CG10_big_fil_rev_8_21_14_0_10_45_34]